MTASQLREKAKQLTKLVGLYPWIRDTKESLYWKIENWQYPLLRRLRQILNVPTQVIAQLSAEFDGLGLWAEIRSQITRELTSDPAYWHGTSSEQDLRALYVLTRVLKPTITMETGVASGASSLATLQALKRNGAGELYSIDLSPTIWGSKIPTYRQIDRVSLPPNKSVGWLVPDALRSRWHLTIGDSKQELPRLLRELGHCDFFYHDAEHTYDAMLWEYRTVWPFLGSGSVLASDDVHWSKAFHEFSQKAGDVATACAWRGFGMMRKA